MSDTVASGPEGPDAWKPPVEVQPDGSKLVKAYGTWSVADVDWALVRIAKLEAKVRDQETLMDAVVREIRGTADALIAALNAKG